MMLDLVIATINEKTGGGTKYINRRDINYIPAAIAEENYRKNLTSVISQYVQGHQTYKYAQVTDLIYKAVFKENAKEYREILRLDSKDNVRHTLYAEVLLVISSFENGVGSAIQERCKQKGNVKLTMEEVESQDLLFRIMTSFMSGQDYDEELKIDIANAIGNGELGINGEDYNIVD